MKFAETLDQKMEESKCTNKSLAEKLTLMGRRISKESIAKYRKGDRTPDPETISYIAEALGVTEQDLFDPARREEIARQEIRRRPMLYAPEFPEIQQMEHMACLPYVTVGAGAEALAAPELAEAIYLPTEILPANFEAKNVLVAKVLGDSMEPKYHENDILFFDMVNGRDVVLPDSVYLVRYGDTVQIKQVQFLGNGDIRIISFNDRYPPVQPRKDLGVDWEILGKPFMHWHADISSRLQEKE